MTIDQSYDADTYAGMCQVTDCGQKNYGHGWCQLHYWRWKRTGDPSVVRIRPKGELLERLAVLAADSSDGPCVTIPTRSGRSRARYQGRLVSMARAVWEIANGGSNGLWILHRCGQGESGCVRLAHLYAGTPTQNSADRLGHGTVIRGERASWAKLTESQVREIRESAERGADLARRFGVSAQLVCDIRKGRRWGWLT